MRQPPRKSTGREAVEKAIEGGLDLVPLAGSSIALAFTYAVNFSHSKRLQEWMEDVATAIDDLQAQPGGPSFDSVMSDPAFLDAIVHATRAAQGTHQQEKLHALRRGVLNSIGGGGPELDEQRRFFRLVDEFSPAHLGLLAFLDDPEANLRQRGLSADEITSSMDSPVSFVLAEFRDRREWFDLVASDLVRAQLCASNVDADMSLWAVGSTMHGWDASSSPRRPLGDLLLSSLGQRFLRFVTT